MEGHQLSPIGPGPRRRGAWKLVVSIAAVWLALAMPAAADFAAGIRAYDAGDYVTAYKEWLALAEQGEPAAQRNVGTMLRLGRGVDRDPAQAAIWYRRAAEQGFDRAQANLANLYMTGDGVPKDYAEAAKWFELAARQGHALSQYDLGLLYEHGLGVPKNEAKALGWYNLAAKAGFKRALLKLSQLVLKEPPAVPAPAPGKAGVAADAPPGKTAKAEPPPADGSEAAAADSAKTQSDEAEAGGSGLVAALESIFTTKPDAGGQLEGQPREVPARKHEPVAESKPAPSPPTAAEPPTKASGPAAEPAPAPARSTAAVEPESSGLLGVLESVFTTRPEAGGQLPGQATAKAAPDAPPAAAPEPAARQPAADADKPAATADGEREGGGILGVIGAIFTTRPDAGGQLDGQPRPKARAETGGGGTPPPASEPLRPDSGKAPDMVLPPPSDPPPATAAAPDGGPAGTALAAVAPAAGPSRDGAGARPHLARPAGESAASLEADAAGTDPVAVSRLMTAAHAGNPRAQFLLGRLYRDGVGLPPDKIRADMWWSLAARQGDAEAVKALAELQPGMSPGQRIEAEALVAGWRKR